MSLRRLATVPAQRSDTVAAVYRDTEWNEWIVYLVIDGRRDEPSSAHCDSLAEAMDTLPSFAALPVERLPRRARH